jgi:hypothetical protein
MISPKLTRIDHDLPLLGKAHCGGVVAPPVPRLFAFDHILTGFANRLNIAADAFDGGAPRNEDCGGEHHDCHFVHMKSPIEDHDVSDAGFR